MGPCSTIVIDKSNQHNEIDIPSKETYSDSDAPATISAVNTVDIRTQNIKVNGNAQNTPAFFSDDMSLNSEESLDIFEDFSEVEPISLRLPVTDLKTLEGRYT